MSAASRYWLLYRLDAAGECKVEEIAAAKAFFSQAFPELTSSDNVTDAKVQRQLWHWWRTISPASDDAMQAAELCLRCYISSVIKQVVVQLELSFGGYYDFTRKDLFPLVLNDIIVERSVKRSHSYTSLATEILQTFNPERSSLSNWTSKLVKQYKELKAFLVERGVYLVTDWAILNDTDTEQLRRVWHEFHHFSLSEIEQACILLASYHTVYRRDRRAARKAGNTGQCPLPTQEQLKQIAQHFGSKTHLTLQTDEVMHRLQDIAENLRQYRIYVRGGTLPSQSLDTPIESSEEGGTSLLEQIPHKNSQEDEDDATEFLQFYRQELIECLDRSLNEVIRHRLNALQRQNPLMAPQFIRALNLYYCQGQSMGEIATQIGLKAQYQVTRFLKLKQFRADVRQLLLTSLLKSVLERVITATNLTDIKNLEEKISIALDEQVTAIIQEAEAESTLAKCSPLNSLFARRLCANLINWQGNDAL